MGTVIGDILPLAVGVALSPIPIIAVILMLFSKNARSTSLGFLAGWFLGVTVVATVVVFIAIPAQQATGGASSPIPASVRILLGVLLLGYSQLVATDFSTTGGVLLPGFMTVTTADGIEITPGALVGEGLYHVLPSMSEERARKAGSIGVVQSRKEVVEALGGLAATVFPVTYKLRVTIRGEKAARAGVVE